MPGGGTQTKNVLVEGKSLQVARAGLLQHGVHLKHNKSNNISLQEGGPTCIKYKVLWDFQVTLNTIKL